MKIYHTETQERPIADIVVDNMNRYMEEKQIKAYHLEQECGSRTIQDMLKKKTVNGCSLVSLQRIAKALGVKTIDLVEDWED